MFDLNTKVLIVDDMTTMRKLVKKACKAIGFSDFCEAKDGNEAFDALTNGDAKDVGLIISDWNMPNCSGLQLLKMVRSNGSLQSLPFVLLTAESEQSQVKEAVQAGVSNYIVKPFTADILKTKLEQTYKAMNAAA